MISLMILALPVLVVAWLIVRSKYRGKTLRVSESHRNIDRDWAPADSRPTSYRGR